VRAAFGNLISKGRAVSFPCRRPHSRDPVKERVACALQYKWRIPQHAPTFVNLSVLDEHIGAPLRFEFGPKLVEVRALPPFAKCTKDGAPQV